MGRGNRGGSGRRNQRQGKGKKSERANPRSATARHRKQPHEKHNAPASFKTPAHSAETRRLLEGIGTPAAAPFKPDPFQMEALAA
ncbi:MAG: hypothetical protein M3447_00720, partial [Acidobacteriota bacterium]|nr:hypothetical protein [Acidobacteriota bacterium]